jgi:hypothetical protein
MRIEETGFRNFAGSGCLSGVVNRLRVKEKPPVSKVALVLVPSTFLVFLPALVTACELRCASVGSASQPAPVRADHCSGHSAGKTTGSRSQAPASEHHSCGGHALLASDTVASVGLNRPLVAIAPGTPIPPSLELTARMTRLPEPASSPPPGPILSVLRL